MENGFRILPDHDNSDIPVGFTGEAKKYSMQEIGSEFPVPLEFAADYIAVRNAVPEQYV